MNRISNFVQPIVHRGVENLKKAKDWTQSKIEGVWDTAKVNFEENFGNTLGYLGKEDLKIMAGYTAVGAGILGIAAAFFTPPFISIVGVLSGLIVLYGVKSVSDRIFALHKEAGWNHLKEMRLEANKLTHIQPDFSPIERQIRELQKSRFKFLEDDLKELVKEKEKCLEKISRPQLAHRKKKMQNVIEHLKLDVPEQDRNAPQWHTTNRGVLETLEKEIEKVGTKVYRHEEALRLVGRMQQSRDPAIIARREELKANLEGINQTLSFAPASEVRKAFIEYIEGMMEKWVPGKARDELPPVIEPETPPVDPSFDLEEV